MTVKFDEQKWKKMVEFVSELLNIEDDRKEKLYNNKIAKFIAALPYIVNSKNPERYSYSNFMTYILANFKKDLASHKKGELLEDRVKPLLNFDNPDEKLVKKAMYILAYASLIDHKYDLENDKKNNKYNPVSSGEIDFEKQKEFYINRIEEIESKEIDNMIDIHNDIKGFWGF